LGNFQTANIVKLLALLPKRPDEGNCELLAFSLSKKAMKNVPPAFASRQVKPLEHLGEDRIAPHKLGLIALHRARLLMGETRRSEKLRIFISHAKFDGIFLAQSIKSAIDQVPDLSSWYDAEDIEGGSDWLTGIQDAASTCVFIAVRIRKAWTTSNTNEFWLVPKALCYDAEFLELRDWLVASKARIALDHLETFRAPPSLS
jgi:hypothetical protein